MANYPVYAKYANDYPNTSSTFNAFVDNDGNIIKIGRDKNTIVGGDNAQIAELKAELEKVSAQRAEFYDKLVEHGIIEEPKTPEQEALEKVLAEVASLKSEIKSLKGAKSNVRRTVNTKKTTAKRKAKSNDSKSVGTQRSNKQQSRIKPVLEE